MKAVFRKFSLPLAIPGILPLFVLAHFGHHLLPALPVPLLPMIRGDFSLDYTQSGFVISAFNLSYGLGQLPAGWLSDRIGPRIMVTVGICGVALAGFFIGISNSFLMMILFLILMGIMGGGYHPAAPPMISAAVEYGSQGRALGFHNIGGSASYFLAPLIATAIAASWGWRSSFIGLAVPAMIFGVFFCLVLGRGTARKIEEPYVPKSHSARSTAQNVRRLVAFIFLSTFTSAVIFSVVSFIPLLLVDRLGFSQETAGAFFALIYSAGLWMSPLGGYLSDRFGTIPMILTVCLLSGPIIYLLNLVHSPYIMAILLLAIGVIIYTRMPVSEAFIIGETPEQNRSSVLGIYYFGSMEGGGILTPVMGYLIDHFGFHLSFTMAGAVVVTVTFICSIWLQANRT